MSAAQKTCALEGCDEPVRNDPRTGQPLKYHSDQHRLLAADRAYRARKAARATSVADYPVLSDPQPKLTRRGREKLIAAGADPAVVAAAATLEDVPGFTREPEAMARKVATATALAKARPDAAPAMAALGVLPDAAIKVRWHAGQGNGGKFLAEFVKGDGKHLYRYGATQGEARDKIRAALA